MVGVSTVVRVLARMKWRVLDNSLSGGRIAVMAVFGVLGILAAGGTALLGSLDVGDATVTGDLLAAVLAVWALGWILLPVLTGGGDETLRPQHFALLPVPPRRLAAGILGAAFLGVPPIVSLVACAGMAVYAARFGVLAVLFAVPVCLLQLALLVALSKVVTGSLGAALNSRRGKDLGAILLAVVGGGAWLLRFPLEALIPRLVDGSAPGFAMVVRALPTGWGVVAVEAAGRSGWAVALGLLVALAALVAVFIAVSARLLAARMIAVASGGGSARAQAAPRGRLLPAGPMGAVVGRELRLWRRDVLRTMGVASMVLGGVACLAVPAVLGATGIAPFGGVALAVLGCLVVLNSYGIDGGSLWHILATPGAARLDVRGRQYAWLLIVGPLAVLASVAGLILDGGGTAYPWLLAALPALLGAGAGLVPLVSVLAAYPVPERGSNPLAARGRMTGPATVAAFVTPVLLAVAALPGCAVVFAGTSTGLPVLGWLGLPVGAAVGVLLAWWCGRTAYRRLAARGPELLATVRRSL